MLQKVSVFFPKESDFNNFLNHLMNFSYPEMYKQRKRVRERDRKSL